MSSLQGISGYLGVIGLGLLAAACGSDGAGPSTPKDVVSELRSSVEREHPPITEALRASQSEQAFGFALLQELDASENLAFSPHSLSAAFAMLTDAAQGDTLREVEQVLAFGEVDEAFHRSQDALKLGLAARNRDAMEGENGRVDAQILSESNDVWIRSDSPPQASYLDTLARFYGVGVHLADFGNAPEASRLAINEKVANDTRQLIQELIKELQITEDTVTVLTNALYFKAPWATRFAEPTPGDFHGLSGDVKSTPMLKTGAHFSYAEGDGFVSVAVPYFGSELEMRLIVPDAGEYERVRAGLSADALSNLVASSAVAKVHLTLPKFSVSSDVPVKKKLDEMGVTTPFDEELADFPKLQSPLFPQVWVSNVLHRATVAIDEKGTEASAATAIILSGTSSAQPEPDPKVVTVDRPFLFVIRDNPTGALLFVGQVVDP